MEHESVDVQPRKWTREEYERMIDADLFGPEDRVELIEGEILVMSPEKTWHAATIDLVAEVLRRVFGDGHTIRVQHPMSLGDRSEPEPDVCVVKGSPRDYLKAHPQTALLVVEVAETSLANDRTRKASLYARMALPEYWIVNLVDGCVEVHRDPSAEVYRTLTRHGRADHVTPLAAPHARIAVSDLLP